ncbi:MAG: arsenic resistance N-acetyltransferase ArsN2, partial [Gemmatimonadota bacterium]
MIAPSTETAAARIRAASQGDLPAVERLLTASQLPLDGVRESFTDFIVAESNGDIVGAAGLEICRDDALLRSVAVHTDWRGKGVGRALVTRAIADAEARGINALYLLTTTAEHYFPTLGFSKVTRDDVPADVRATKEFTTACPDSAVAMKRALRTP